MNPNILCIGIIALNKRRERGEGMLLRGETGQVDKCFEYSIEWDIVAGNQS